MELQVFDDSRRRSFITRLSLFSEKRLLFPKLAEPDLSIGGLLSVGASTTTTVTPRGVESLETVAYQLADQVSNDAIRSRVITCEPTDVSDESCMREVIESLGSYGVES